MSGLDTIGWFIAVLHEAIGHEKAARYLGQANGDQDTCVLCRYDRGEATRQEVLDALEAKP